MMPTLNAEPTLVLGTGNRHKRIEMTGLLKLPGVRILSLSDFTDVPDVVEDGATFLENAQLKATAFANAFNQWTLAEDSGLEVDALGGAPGIYSARHAGVPTDDERNNDKLLADLADLSFERRTARYVCVAVIADPSGAIRGHASGFCPGRIGFSRRGTNGFGYDPLFFPLGQEKTFGELSPEIKQATSHRANALVELNPLLAQLLYNRV